MPHTYQLTKGTNVIRTSDGARIPCDPRNADYQAYQAWISAGNAASPYTPPGPNYAVLARAALTASDMVALRCMKAGVVYPAAWLSYVRTLRAIVAGTQTGPLPAQPAYPSGT
jgi:hypothetical protein